MQQSCELIIIVEIVVKLNNIDINNINQPLWFSILPALQCLKFPVNNTETKINNENILLSSLACPIILEMRKILNSELWKYALTFPYDVYDTNSVLIHKYFPQAGPSPK